MVSSIEKCFYATISNQKSEIPLTELFKIFLDGFGVVNYITQFEKNNTEFVAVVMKMLGHRDLTFDKRVSMESIFYKKLLNDKNDNLLYLLVIVGIKQLRQHVALVDETTERNQMLLCFIILHTFIMLRLKLLKYVSTTEIKKIVRLYIEKMFKDLQDEMKKHLTVDEFSMILDDHKKMLKI